MLMQIGRATLRMKAEDLPERRQLARVANHLKQKGIQFSAVVTERDEVCELKIFFESRDMSEEWIEAED
jgi:hypothetical protein